MVAARLTNSPGATKRKLRGRTGPASRIAWRIATGVAGMAAAEPLSHNAGTGGNAGTEDYAPAMRGRYGCA
jgi:hypothetical protein